MEAAAYRANNALDDYKKNEIMTLSPVRLILKLYDYVLINSRKRNTAGVNAGLTELIAALNFDYKEISLGLFKLYRYCQTESRKGNFEEVVKVISELRAAWAQGFKLS